MSAPFVCCVCLTADRQRLTERAVRCFLSQTYTDSWLLIYDTGAVPFELPESLASRGRIVTVYNPSARGHAIGALRNEAIELTGKAADVIATWDSDDSSERERLAVQVEQLESGGWPAVGFHNLLFLDTRDGRYGEAWEYDKHRGCHGTAIGTSLVYWRETWMRQPFDEHKMVGEDEHWHRLVKAGGFNGIGSNPPHGDSKPLLIAEVHGNNTSGVYIVFDRHQPAHQPEWRRVPEFDAYCRERLYL